MKKPHETTLSVMQFDRERRCIAEDGTRMVAVLRNYDSEGWEDFLTASTDMARALLALLPEDDGHPRNHTRECLKWRTEGGYITECLPGCIEAMDALRKAKVLP